MAEEKAEAKGKSENEKELDLDSDSQEQESEDAGKSRKKIILIAAAALVLIGGGAAAYLFLGSDPEAAELAELEEEEPVPVQAVYLELDPPFVVSLPDRGRQRFLQANITVRSRDRAAILKLEQHMPAVRHNLSNVLSAQTVSSIQTPGGIEQVRQEATEQLNKILSEELDGDAIEDVLFTSFVMQ
jgi:flagellar FliL protein